MCAPMKVEGYSSGSIATGKVSQSGPGSAQEPVEDASHDVSLALCPYAAHPSYPFLLSMSRPGPPALEKAGVLGVVCHKINIPGPPGCGLCNKLMTCSRKKNYKLVLMPVSRSRIGLHKKQRSLQRLKD